jgi:LDH2 family malate/lactate/ureidoglycolate dehydrogenase
MALDPDCFIDGRPSKRTWTPIETIKRSARASGTEEILVPGEPEYRTEQKFLKGESLAPNTAKRINPSGKSLGIPLFD